MNNTDIIQTIALVLLALRFVWVTTVFRKGFQGVSAWMESIALVLDERDKEYTARLGDLERRVGAKWVWDGEDDDEDPGYDLHAMGRVGEDDEDDDEGTVN